MAYFGWMRHYFGWVGVRGSEIKKSPEYNFYDSIRHVSVRSSWYHSDDTKRNPRVMLCSHCPINDSSGYLYTTVYLAVMLQASWHTKEHN